MTGPPKRKYNTIKGRKDMKRMILMHESNMQSHYETNQNSLWQRRNYQRATSLREHVIELAEFQCMKF